MTKLIWLDWAIIATILCLSMGIGVLVSRRAGASSASFFLSGRNMPWWLLGASMVATTFSTDTPNLVTEIVRTQGVVGIAFLVRRVAGTSAG
jgi:SSS family solute:Na+ symporter